MAEVHEITRRAFNELSNGPRWYDGVRSFGDYVVVHAYARFAGAPYAFFEVEHFDTEYWACRRCDGMQEVALYNGVLGGCEGRVSYYEVWHIVDDADDEAETRESLRQLREAGALDGAYNVVKYPKVDNLNIVVKVTVPDFDMYPLGKHPKDAYMTRWDDNYFEYHGLDCEPAFFYGFEYLTAWDVDTICGLRMNCGCVVEVMDRTTFEKNVDIPF